MNNSVILSKIVMPSALDEYRLQDDHLDKFLDELPELMSTGRESASCNINITKLIPAGEVKDIEETRLALFDDKELFVALSEEELLDLQKMKYETEKLVSYCLSNTSSYIKVITINSPKHSYLVHCGVNGEHIDVVCVIRGKHLPIN